jgi:hypothetical protein
MREVDLAVWMQESIVGKSWARGLDEIEISLKGVAESA